MNYIVSVFMEIYPAFRLTRQRALRCQGTLRGSVSVSGEQITAEEPTLIIYPPPLPPPPAEVVHRQSTIVPMPHNPRQVMVVEWTGTGDRHLHLVNVDAL